MTAQDQPQDQHRAEEVVIEMLEELTADLDVGAVTRDRALGSFGLESISLVYLIAELKDVLELGDGFVLALRSSEVGLLDMTVGELTVIADTEREGALS